MKIKELIKQLKKYDEDYSVEIKFVSENADELVVDIDNECGVVVLKEF